MHYNEALCQGLKTNKYDLGDLIKSKMLEKGNRNIGTEKG